jgi:hypothetical protein
MLTIINNTKSIPASMPASKVNAVPIIEAIKDPVARAYPWAAPPRVFNETNRMNRVNLLMLDYHEIVVRS